MISEKATHLFLDLTQATIDNYNLKIGADEFEIEANKLLDYMAELEGQREEMLKMLIEIRDTHDYPTIRVTIQSINNLIEKVKSK